MSNTNALLLLSKNDIPFINAQLIIHQPTIREIALIGEEIFYGTCSLLKFSKEKFLNEQDKINLEDISDFEIFMMMLLDKRNNNRGILQNNIRLLFSLLFPNQQVQFSSDIIQIIDESNPENVVGITSETFNEFQDILTEMFCLQQKDTDLEYNPKNALAKKIAEKLYKGRNEAARVKGQSQKINILGRYISILSVGEHKDMNDFFEYTVYQLFDEFNRYELKESYEMFLRAKMAGAKEVKDPENWMKDIH